MTKLVLPALLCLSIAASAQQLDLPRPSPAGKVTQTVGLTDISVDYSSPAVGGREIFGGLLPWGQIWRAGANAPTKVTFSKDVSIGGTAVPAGTYSFFVIPNKDAPWTAIFNKDTVDGVFAYKQDQDVVRVDVKPEAIPNRERLAFLVANGTNDSATIDLEWEKVRVSVPVKLGTDEQVAKLAKAVDDGANDPFTSLANYYRQIKKDYDSAIAWADKSIKLRPSWQNMWARAQALAGKGKYKEAVAALDKAMALGKEKSAPQFFVDQSTEQKKEWSAKK